jgi:hypothetical protein
MSRKSIEDPRFDFRGGLNSGMSEDILNRDEFRSGKNARALLGEIEKRAGSKRLHGTAIGAGDGSIKGVYQWDSPTGPQLIAIAGGHFYHKLMAAANYTQIASTLSTTDRATFSPYRFGANVKLLIADKALRTWDGTTLVTTIVGAPAADRALIYKLRAFAINGTKSLFFSKIGDPTLWAVADGGGSIDIETYDDSQNMGIIVLGSSLLIFKQDNVARFTGVDTNNIRVDVETEGISGEVGLIAPNALTRFDEVAFFLSDRGPYLATEAGVKEIGLKVHRSFDFGNRQLWAQAQSSHNRRRKEIWLSLGAPEGDPSTAQPKHTWIYHYPTDTWSGPFIFNDFAVSATSRLERIDGTESVMIGGFDGYVREADDETVGSVDDVLSDGSGGNTVEMDVVLPDITAGMPDSLKNMRGKNLIAADLGATSSSLTAYWSSELGSGEVAIASTGAGVKQYRYKLAAKGARIIHGFRSTSTRIIRILGVIPKLKISRSARS